MAALPHLLAPDTYGSAAQHARDVARLRRGWHCVGSRQDLPAVGDFLTIEICGTTVLVHRTKDGPRAFVNACAHRHTALTLAPRGHAERLRCPYHGWEYDAAGVACKIPDAACFMPFQHGDFRLQRLPLEALGELLFVHLDPEAPAISASLPRVVSDEVPRLFPATRRQVLSMTVEHAANWKVPIENVLEDYHVAMLHDHFLARHPRLFRFFQGRASADRQRHDVHATHTSVHDRLGADSRLYERALRFVREDADTDFVHTHAFPNVLLGATGVLGFFQEVLPVTPTSSRSIVRISMDLPERGAALRELTAAIGARLAKVLFEQLTREDARVFPNVQRGKASSKQPGVLSTAEVRLHAFHRWLADADGDGQALGAERSGR